ncbi:c-type cytochrome [Aliikangiella coralliicola]|uniref:C-type cytochrome n=2 Tax=Aliikangiella coralliicola TaxID=2592383 RepID=A0A545UF32_9GAMM|nr:c-type cytochrome [Aliikangiella coralliicola]
MVSLVLTSPFVVAQEYEKRSPPRKLTTAQAKVAEANYKKYCVLCHGEDRQGHVNDHAPSLRSQSLFESGVPHAILRPLSFGREGTPMGGYLDEVGGPMTLDEVWNLTYWLFEKSGAERVRLSTKPVYGDIKQGEKIYQKECADCHGKSGEGVTGPALGNQSALAHNTDEFIRYAIRHGRQDTPMPAFEDKLSSADIDNVTAFLRSRGKNWEMKKNILKALPTPEQYVINPDGKSPNFELSDGLYVSSHDLNKALVAKNKMVLLDTRVTSVWQTAHIEGAVPLPYYADLEATVKDIPKDVQIVAYCSCPRAAADSVIKQLRGLGYKKTATLYEGIFGWMNMGYPVMHGDVLD